MQSGALSQPKSSTEVTNLLKDFGVSYSDLKQLIRAAIESASTSSKLRLTSQKELVGAAVLTSDSTISSGSNFESVSLSEGQGLSAEDCAIYRAICDRCKLPIKAMAVHHKHLL